MKIEIVYNEDFSMTRDEYVIFNLENNSRISNSKRNFNKVTFDIEDIEKMLSDTQLKKFENGECVFNVPKYLIDYVSSGGMCDPKHFHKIPKESRF